MNIQQLRNFAEALTEYHSLCKYESLARKHAPTLVHAYLACQTAIDGEPAQVAISVSAIKSLPKFDGEAAEWIDKAREALHVVTARLIHEWMYPPEPEEAQDPFLHGDINGPRDYPPNHVGIIAQTIPSDTEAPEPIATAES